MKSAENALCLTPSGVTCFAIALKWFYNSTAGECQSTGCRVCTQGNFKDKEQCKKCCKSNDCKIGNNWYNQW